MKKLLIIISIVLAFGCSGANTLGNIRQVELLLVYSKNFSYTQFDSICKVDKLPSLEKWNKTYFKTNTNSMLEYLYIDSSKVYRVYNIKDSLNVTKRNNK